MKYKIRCCKCHVLYKTPRLVTNKWDTDVLLLWCVRCYKKFPSFFGPIIAKECSRCVLMTPINNYGKDNHTWDGKQAHCSGCQAKYIESKKLKKMTK